MNKLEQLRKLAEEVPDAQTILALLDLVELQHEALKGAQVLEHLRDFKKERTAIDAYNKFKEGK